MSKMPTNQLWYTRRGKEIRGPFPVGMITRHILLGRIVEQDELSKDQRDWQPVSSLPDLIPAEMKLDLSVPENQERLKLARLREDERDAGDRRHTQGQVSKDLLMRRKGDERRDMESKEMLRHREIKTAINKSLRAQPERFGFKLVWLLLFISGIVWLAISTTGKPNHPIVNVKCSSQAGPNVDWSFCRKAGANLAHVNLAGARLRNISLPGATLSGATLVGSDLHNANLKEVTAHAGNFRYAKLLGAVLHNADLSGSNLAEADLSNAVLFGANLSGTDLRGANLTHAVLNNAKLEGADLTGAILDKAIWVDNTVCAPGSIGQCIPVKKP